MLLRPPTRPGRGHLRLPAPSQTPPLVGSPPGVGGRRRGRLCGPLSGECPGGPPPPEVRPWEPGQRLPPDAERRAPVGAGGAAARGGAGRASRAPPGGRRTSQARVTLQAPPLGAHAQRPLPPSPRRPGARAAATAAVVHPGERGPGASSFTRPLAPVRPLSASKHMQALLSLILPSSQSWEAGLARYGEE